MIGLRGCIPIMMATWRREAIFKQIWREREIERWRGIYRDIEGERGI